MLYSRFNVGDIVLATYRDFSDTLKNGIFLIIYNEKQDRSYSSGHGNIICAKITTQLDVDTYCVKVKQGDLNLDKNCVINVSKTTVFKTDSVLKIIGHCDRYYMKNILKAYLRFTSEVQRQIMDLV